jgi:peroxiredoxin
MTDPFTSQESDVTAEPAPISPTNGRNPLVIFIGLLLLGTALALLLFSDDLFDGSQSNAAAPNDTAELPVLDQVNEFPTAESIVAELPPSNPDGLLEVGDKALNFTLPDLEGNPVSLGDFQGQPVIINFWATWCPPCRIEMPELQTVYETYQDQGLVILALNQDETADIAKAYFVDEMGLTFTPLLDDNSAISTAYGNFGLPTTFFVDGDGTIAVVHRGPMTTGQIEGYLAEILPG